VKPGKRVIVIGAGIGGLSVAAWLARAGLDVSVLEAHIYPGGCAGTFYHQGYRFNAGTTIAGGFFPGGPMDLLAQTAGTDHWPGRPADPAMIVHLPDGVTIPRLESDERWEQYEHAFGDSDLRFWKWQEQTADVLWDLATWLPPWLPQSPREISKLIKAGSALLLKTPAAKLPQFAIDSIRPVATHLNGTTERLRLFVDAQLLISAQTTGSEANALYGAVALDLPRRWVFYLEGGMGAIADSLVKSFLEHGQTGYPVVDAAMRRLSQEGWIHNRARMIVASFLTKDLLIDWRWGERHFMQHLADGDPAANNGGWQWIAGTGTDAAPYFRVFNPVLQSNKYDPTGEYIRRFVPELDDVPGEFIHAPWKMPIALQQETGCLIGKDYPAPLVDHSLARERALNEFKTKGNLSNERSY
jgi:hypothetical protein